MKKGLIILIAIVVILGSLFIGQYNGLVRAYETVNVKSADIQTQLQRRSDLIPNLVATVKGYAKHEEQVFKDISDARARLAGATTTTELAQGDAAMTSALSRLLAIAENYPDLKANTNFIQLQDELAGTENRIAVARRDYNQSAQGYNQMIKGFPGVIFANMFNYKAVPYFEADKGATENPKVDFNT